MSVLGASKDVWATGFTWLLLNISLNYYNAYVLGHTNFHYPFFFTLGNKLTTVVILGSWTVFTRWRAGQRIIDAEPLREQMMRPGVLAFGTLTGINVGMNNWSLMLMTLTLNQVMKSTTPLATALLSYLYEDKRFDWQMWGSVAVLVLGCVLAAWGAFDQDYWLGIVFCVFSVLLTASWVVAVAILTQRGSAPFGAVNLILVSSPMTIVTLGIFFVTLELPHLLNPETDPNRPVPPLSVMLALTGIGSLIACAYDVLHNQFVKITSSVNVSIMGNAKLALLIALSMGTLERPPTPLRIVGVTLSFAATVWYAVYQARAAADPPAAAPSVEEGTSSGAEKTGLLR